MTNEEDVAQVFHTVVGFVAAYDKLVDELLVDAPVTTDHESAPVIGVESLAHPVLGDGESMKSPPSRVANMSATRRHSSLIASPVRTSTY
jgi:hypothetical protein